MTVSESNGRDGRDRRPAESSADSPAPSPSGRPIYYASRASGGCGWGGASASQTLATSGASSQNHDLSPPARRAASSNYTAVGTDAARAETCCRCRMLSSASAGLRLTGYTSRSGPVTEQPSVAVAIHHSPTGRRCSLGGYSTHINSPYILDMTDDRRQERAGGGGVW